MKIAINGRFLLPQLEGIGHYTLQMVDQLSRQHPTDEWHVILDRKYRHPILERENIIPHVLYPSARHPILWHVWFEWRLARLLKKIEPDVFFSPDGYLSLRSTVPTVLTIHDLAYLHYPEGSQYTHLKYLKRYMPRYIDRADWIICVSQYTADDVCAHFPSVKDKISAIPNGVSDRFRALSLDEIRTYSERFTRGRPYFLYLGAIHPRKNIVRLIKAFEAYKDTRLDDPTVLLLAGRMAWDVTGVSRAIDDSRYKTDIIHMIPTDGDVPYLVGAAKAMCYVSLFEGFGLPVLESLSAAVPVITSQASAMQEICGDAALYVDPTDISSINDAMRMIHQDITSPIVDLGLERSKNFTWYKSAEQVYNLLLKVSS